MGCATSSVEKSIQLHHHSFHMKYVLGEKVHCGSFGKVRTASARNPKLDKTRYAVHVIELKNAAGAPDHKLAHAVKHVATLWSRCSKHPNIVALQESCFEEHLGYYVFELCVSSLADNIERTLRLDRTCRGLFRDMLSGISYVHSAGVVHRNISPHSFAVCGENDPTIKLIGFDHAADMPRHGTLSDEMGDVVFSSPEMLEGAYGYKTDIWSFGVVVHMLLYDGLPYDPEEHCKEAMLHSYASGPRPKFESNDFPERIAEFAAEFARAVLELNVNSRCSAHEALAMPYLKVARSVSHVEYQELKQQTIRKSNIIVRRQRQRTQSFDHAAQESLDKQLVDLQTASSSLSSSSFALRNFRMRSSPRLARAGPSPAAVSEEARVNEEVRVEEVQADRSHKAHSLDSDNDDSTGASSGEVMANSSDGSGARA